MCLPQPDRHCVMSSTEASAANSKLPKGFKYVPVAAATQEHTAKQRFCSRAAAATAVTHGRRLLIPAGWSSFSIGWTCARREGLRHACIPDMCCCSNHTAMLAALPGRDAHYKCIQHPAMGRQT